jgi:hypothetical protein
VGGDAWAKTKPPKTPAERAAARAAKLEKIKAEFMADENQPGIFDSDAVKAESDGGR